MAKDNDDSVSLSLEESEEEEEDERDCLTSIADSDNVAQLKTPKPKHHFFEQLGVPILLYRETASYNSIMDAVVYPPTVESIGDAWSRRKRAEARWYYPLDHQAMIVDSCAPKNSDGTDENNAYYLDRDSTDFLLQVSAGDQDNSQQRADLRQVQSFLADSEYRLSQSLDILQPSRCHFLMETLPSTTSMEDVARTIQLYQRFDVTSLPGVAQTKSAKPPPSSSSSQQPKDKQQQLFAVPSEFRKPTRDLARQRHLAADPAYHAPFGVAALDEALRDSVDDSTNAFNRHLRTSRQRRNLKRTRNTDYLGSPDATPWDLEGNCLCQFVCPCIECRRRTAAASVRGAGEQQQPAHFVLHPTGPLLDCVCLSHMQFPRGPRVLERTLDPTLVRCKASRRNLQRVLPLRHRICQIEAAAATTSSSASDIIFLVRTEQSVTLIALDDSDPCGIVVQEKSNDNVDNAYCCHGSRLQLQAIHEFRLEDSWWPRHVAVHPKYGGWSPMKLAILCEHLGDPLIVEYSGNQRVGFRRTVHRIGNLSEIGKIEYSCSREDGPSILWATATSFVRPVPVTTPAVASPHLGNGRSLYSIDLKTNLATLEWSPSAANFQVEGVESLTSLQADWLHETIIVGSATAGMAWELTSDRPFQVKTRWSLTSTAEHITPQLAQEQSLLHLPTTSGACSAVAPIVTAGRTATAIAIHQRPNHPPKIGTDSLEAPSCPGLSHVPDLSVAATGQIILDDVPLCGLASSLVPIHQILSKQELKTYSFIETDDDDDDDADEILPAAMVIYTLTARGDLYGHVMLASLATTQKSRALPQLPLGMSIIPVAEDPLDQDDEGSQVPSSRPQPQLQWIDFVRNVLPSNQIPVPGHKIVAPFDFPLYQKKKPKQGGEKSNDGLNNIDQRVATAIETYRNAAGVPEYKQVKTDYVEEVPILAGNEVKLHPPELHDEARENLTTTTGCFVQAESAVERDKLDPNQCRSDVTSSLLSKLDQDWSTNDKHE